MASFDEAVSSWTQTINDWYFIKASPEEVKSAFYSYKKWRDKMDEPGEIPYVNTFFMDKDDNWRTMLDTVDREYLSYYVEEARKLVDFREKVKVPTQTLTKEQLVENATTVIENELNALWDAGLSNDELKALLNDITIDINRGFVGEPC